MKTMDELDAMTRDEVRAYFDYCLGQLVREQEIAREANRRLGEKQIEYRRAVKYLEKHEKIFSQKA